MELKCVETKDELLQILDIQKDNLIGNLSEDTKHTKGFLTVAHSFEILEAMNQKRLIL